MTKEREEEGNKFYTFEWICNDPGCSGKGNVHRKRIRAQSQDKAILIAGDQGIPTDAKIVEEAEEKLRMRILW